MKKSNGLKKKNITIEKKTPTPLMMVIFTRKTSYFRDMKKSYELRRVK